MFLPARCWHEVQLDSAPMGEASHVPVLDVVRTVEIMLRPAAGER
jgi:hypothetical protein